VVGEWDYVFSENGLVAFKEGSALATQSLKAHLGEAKLKSLINFILHYIADLDIPIKRGTFIEFRAGMLNVSPIGRNCSQAERVEFEQYDSVHHVRRDMIQAMTEKFADYGLTYSIGGQLSFDVFPSGWDKTYCLQFLEKDGFKEIHFFGDKTFKVRMHTRSPQAQILSSPPLPSPFLPHFPSPAASCRSLCDSSVTVQTTNRCADLA